MAHRLGLRLFGGTLWKIQCQGLGGDRAGLGQGLHAHATCAQVRIVAVIQGGQGGKQACLLACSRIFHRWHLDLPAFFYLGARGPERPMCGIMEHAWGWCK
jgi:hypothetical protein